MMISQALVSVLLDSTRVSCYSYYFLTLNNPKTTYEKIFAGFIFQLSNALLYMNYAQSFYIYTLASSLFRKTFLNIVHNYYAKLFRLVRSNQIHPTNGGGTNNNIISTNLASPPAVQN